ncbi:MAG: hypothetical protein D6796_04320 [Caldilineae bacterium]|nr:MAG: hypothetical protein D6796_04320 [Caldilineae bacterium]
MTTHPGATPPRSTPPPAERTLVARYTPRLLLDRHEPFRPLAVGYTLFHADGYSPSFPRIVGLTPVATPPAAFAIEYAIWWDWDIQHLYELEHFWTYVDASGAVVRAEGSWHGDFWAIARAEGEPPHLHNGTHPIAYAQPGKHALTSSTDPLLIMKDHTRQQCSANGKKGGVWLTPVSRPMIADRKSPHADRLVNEYLQSRAFEPAFVWDTPFDISPDLLCPWPTLADWIPQRVDYLLAQLNGES